MIISLLYCNGIRLPIIYPTTIPINRAIVSTRDLTNSSVYPFLIATILTPWPKALIIQKNGMVITLINMGPMIGIMAITAPNPATTCVNIPRISVAGSYPPLTLPTKASV